MKNKPETAEKSDRIISEDKGNKYITGRTSVFITVVTAVRAPCVLPAADGSKYERQLRIVTEP